MEPGRTLFALVSEAGQVSTRFLCGSFSYVEVYVLWFCGEDGSLLVEVTQTGFYKSHMVKRKSVNQERFGPVFEHPIFEPSSTLKFQSRAFYSHVSKKKRRQICAVFSNSLTLFFL